MSFLYNSSGSFGIILDAFTYNVTGSLFLTLLAMVIIILAFCLMFKIPMEYSAILIMPLLITIMAYSSDFKAVGGVAIIYIAVLVARYWIIK
ncbi:MAG: hypothetical protein ACP5N3_04180 [Candidatus Nanoarchaeia archaeon]